METIPNVATADGYAAACTIEDGNAVAGTYLVANAAVVAQFKPKRADGTDAPWGPELVLSPQSNNVVGCAGMRFRSAVAGVSAQIIAALFDKGDPLPGAATPFSQRITAAGSVTPGLSSVQLQVDGALVGAEPTLNLLSTLGLIVAADDAANQRINVTLPIGLGRIADANLGAPATVTFSSIPGSYKHLVLVWSAAINGAAENNLTMLLNGDTGLNYDYSIFEALNGVANIGGAAPTSAVLVGTVGTTASLYKGVVFIPDYLTTLTGKSVIGINTGTAVNRRVGVYGGRWGGTVSINAIQLSASGGNFLAGSRFTLYGMA